MKTTQKHLIIGTFCTGWSVLVLLAVLVEIRIAGSERELGLMCSLAYLSFWGLFFLMSQLSRRQKTLRFTVTTLSLVFAVLAAELIGYTGVVDYRLVFNQVQNPWEHPDNLLDRELIHIHKPHINVNVAISGGDLVPWCGAVPTTYRQFNARYDANGFRNPVDFEAADYVVIGDSFIEAGNVADDELASSHLSRLLDAEVANLGQACYGPQQELKVLERFAVGLRPHTCVWVFYEGNDLQDVSRYRDFQVNWGNFESEHTSYKAQSFTKNLLTWSQSLSRRSQTNYATSGMYESKGGPIRIWFGDGGRQLLSAELEALTWTAETLEQAFNTCYQNSTRLCVVYAPTKFRVYGDMCKFAPGSPLADDKPNDLPDRLFRIVSEISDKIIYLDLTHSFRTAASSGHVLYYPDDSHWSPAGHELAAREIFEKLRQSPAARIAKENANPIKRR